MLNKHVSVERRLTFWCMRRVNILQRRLLLPHNVQIHHIHPRKSRQQAARVPVQAQSTDGLAASHAKWIWAVDRRRLAGAA